MYKKIFVLIVIILSMIVVGYFLSDNWNNAEYLSKTKHETDSWAIVMDSKGDIIAVEPTDSNVWDSLIGLSENQTEMWIGGIIEEYQNHWGFRFKPGTIIIAEVTIEGAQSNIQGISGELDYWINVWTRQTYVLAKVIEIHE